MAASGVAGAVGGAAGGGAVASSLAGRDFQLECHSEEGNTFYFEDQTGDEYKLWVLLTFRNHNVCYSSAAPSIVSVSW